MTKQVKKIAALVVGAVGFILLAWSLAFGGEVKVAILDSGTKESVDGAVSFTAYPATQDPLNHGTQVTKLIRQGYPQAKIYMLQVCDKINGSLKPSREAILSAIKWCIENNINIVNMSLVTNYDKEIEKAITNASTSHGVLFIAAAGNKDIASHFAADSHGFICKVAKIVKPAFPASNSLVIAVGGLDGQGRLAEYSDKTCDTYENGKILGQEGSSFACARVTGKIAQLFANNPQLTKTSALAYLNK